MRAIKAQGRRAIAIQADNADPKAIQSSIDKTVAELGGLDILVNNAGILRLGELKDISLEDIDAILDVNVRGPIVASKSALPHLAKGGRIITIGSFCADRVAFVCPERVCSVEIGVGCVHQGIGASELGPKEITVNLVQPGLHRH